MTDPLTGPGPYAPDSPGRFERPGPPGAPSLPGRADQSGVSRPDAGRDWTVPMGIALDAARGLGDAPGGDVPVGAVVLDAAGRLVADAVNERESAHDPTAHAEVLALRAAGAALGAWRLTGCTLVVTLEPCTMCAGAAVLARVERIVFGAWDPRRGAVGSLWDVVRDRRLNHRPEVVSGVRAEECRAVLDRFFAARRVG